jgi:hypothetical protein
MGENMSELAEIPSRARPESVFTRELACATQFEKSAGLGFFCFLHETQVPKSPNDSTLTCVPRTATHQYWLTSGTRQLER